MDDPAERAQIDAMRQDLDDLRRLTVERRLLEHGTAEFEAIEKREQELIRRIRAWSLPPPDPAGGDD